MKVGSYALIHLLAIEHCHTHQTHSFIICINFIVCYQTSLFLFNLLVILLIAFWDTRIILQWRIGKKEKKKNTPIYFNTNYRTEMKLVLIIMIIVYINLML